MSERYEPRRPPKRREVRLGGQRTCVYDWPGRGEPVILLHGWGDTGATFQFLVDALPDERRALAIDWRGFGDSAWCESYWFPDYLRDLERLLDERSPDRPADLIGHSMGGNVAALYAGIRPHRVRRLVSLEGFGLETADPAGAPARYARWLDELADPPRFADYADFEALAGRVRRRSPSLDPARARYVAECWARREADGRIRLKADPRHKRVNPVLYRRGEAEACWARVAAPVLLLAGTRSFGGDPGRSGVGHYPNARFEPVAGAGHMLHFEQPADVARRIAAFVTA
jgi:pimeloyl-ACP methyl ester carboxylesterase